MAVLLGTTGIDRIFGTSYSDLIRGFQGNDVLNGKEGDDEVEGGKGEDFISGEYGIDSLTGALDSDTIIGGRDADILYGDRNYVDSTLKGRGLTVSEGSDGYNGPARFSDTFVFESSASENGIDVIKDLDVGIAPGGVYDKLNLKSALSRASVSSGNVGAYVKARLSDGKTFLEVDRDGAGTSKTFEKFAEVNKFVPAASDSFTLSDLSKPLTLGDQILIDTGSFVGFITVT